jgi:hypothetical protein
LKPDLQFSLICDDVRREDNGKFILIGLFEAIGAASFPFVYPGLRVVNRWCNGEGNFSQKIRLMSPGNEILSETPDSPVGLPGTQANVTSVSYLGNLRFSQPGRYWVEVLLDGDLKQRYSLTVVKIESAPPPPPAAP